MSGVWARTLLAAEWRREMPEGSSSRLKRLLLGMPPGVFSAWPDEARDASDRATIAQLAFFDGAWCLATH